MRTAFLRTPCRRGAECGTAKRGPGAELPVVVDLNLIPHFLLVGFGGFIPAVHSVIFIMGGRNVSEE